ncbi:MAG: flavodoxin family protein [Slackia sp.]|nr:flavodoxin family protein [Slackia sp.]
MNILGINGSHRAGKSTATLLKEALASAQAHGANVEMVELAQLDVNYCIGCNACLRSSTCALHDDMDGLYLKMRNADGIVFASPNYFANVSARMKCFIDRTRPFHMVENQLKGKVAGVVISSGLGNCGGEAAAGVLKEFCATHEMIVVNPRPAGPVRAADVLGTQARGFTDEGMVEYRKSAAFDPVALEYARQLGSDMVELIKRLS